MKVFVLVIMVITNDNQAAMDVQVFKDANTCIKASGEVREQLKRIKMKFKEVLAECRERELLQ